MKTQLREQIRQSLRAMDEMTRYTRSLAACKRLTAQPEFHDANVVMLYLALPDEVESANIALTAWQGGKTVVVPKVQWEHNRIMPVEISSLELGMTVGRFGVPEPTNYKPVPMNMLDLIVVPGLAFDRKGWRLGRGGGCYDRFLSQPALTATTCGLAFQEQVREELPVEDHDLPVNMLVTDEELLRFEH